MIARTVAVIAIAILSTPAMAQQVWQAEAGMTPIVYQDDSGYTGCGLRVVVAFSQGNQLVGSDFTVNLFLKPQPIGAIKVAGMKCATPCDPMKANELPVDSFRLSNEETGVPVKILEATPADRPEFTIAWITVSDAADTIMALLGGQRMQLGLMPKGSDYRQIFSFVGQISDEDARTFSACMLPVIDKIPE